jgi:hypothetical protein
MSVELSSEERQMTQATIPSRTSEQTYTVTLFDDGTTACTCKAGQFGKPCWHMKALLLAVREEVARRQDRPAWRVASARTGKTLSTHATLDEAVVAKAAVNRAGGTAFVDAIA